MIAIVTRWVIGLGAGTLIIAVTSPLFVRSYLPLRIDPLRQTWTLTPQSVVRWRSEGYADTSVGPLGMPGQRVLLSPSTPEPVMRIALWGDSQVEGVCVADDDKLFAALQTRLPFRSVVYPLARSGEDARVWLTQMPIVTSPLGIDLHVIVIVDTDDLAIASVVDPAADAAAAATAAAPPQNDRVAIATRLPAFIVSAARHLLTEADGQTPRSLQFAVGPRTEVPATPGLPATAGPDARDPSDPGFDWASVMRSIRDAAGRDVLIVLAPRVPEIVDGRPRWTPQSPATWDRLGQAARAAGIGVVAVGDDFVTAAKSGQWPHGFHNGQFGVGHLNAAGNRIVAAAIARRLSGSDATRDDGWASPASSF